MNFSESIYLESEGVEFNRSFDLESNETVHIHSIYRHSPFITGIFIFIYSFVAIVGIVGNIFVILVIYKGFGRRTVTNYFILNLAVADLLVVIFCAVPTLLSNIYTPWLWGLVLCKVMSYIQGVSVCASIYSLVAISVNRYLAIRFSIRLQFTTRKAFIIISGIWLLSSTLAFPLLFVFGIYPGAPDQPDFLYCQERWWSTQAEKLYYGLVNLLIYYILPLVLILFCCVSSSLTKSNINNTNVNNRSLNRVQNRNRNSAEEKVSPREIILLHTDKSKHQQIRLANPSRTRTGQKQKQKQRTRSTRGRRSNCKYDYFQSPQQARVYVFKGLALVVFAFFLSWLPLYSIVVRVKLISTPWSQLEDKILAVAMPFAQWIATCNSCMNPLLYSVFDPKLRKGFLKLILCRRMRRGR